jgi:hypothetical protein
MSWSLKIAEGLGFVALQNAVEEYVQNGGEKFKCQVIYEGEYSAKAEIRTIRLDSALSELMSDINRRTRNARKFDESYDIYDTTQTMKQLAQYYCDCDSWGSTYFIGTESEYQEQQKEDRRKELDSIAKEYCDKKKLRLGTMEFLEAIYSEIYDVKTEQEEFNSYERLAEEYAAYRYSGCTDSYYDDKNYTNSQYNGSLQDLYDILEWFQSECPLTWAKFQEKRMSEDN